MQSQNPNDESQRHPSMNAKNIPVVKVSRGGAVGTPEEFENRYERRRKKGSGQVRRTPGPKLKPIENKSLEERLADHGIEET